MSNRRFNEIEHRLKPVARVYGTDARWIRIRIGDYFGTLDFSGKRVLDIGAGKGLYAVSIAALGAEKVVALEPQFKGAHEDTIKTFNERVNALKLNNLEFLPTPMQEFKFSEPFDVIYMLAVINHLNEEHVQTLHVSESSRQVYTKLMQPLIEWLKPEGTLVISDASRTSFFTPLLKLGILKRHPFQPTITWEIHQSPHVWKMLLEKIGFTSVEYHWATNWRYPWIPRFLCDNVIAANVYSSLFVLRAYRPGRMPTLDQPLT